MNELSQRLLGEKVLQYHQMFTDEVRREQDCRDWSYPIHHWWPSLICPLLVSNPPSLPTPSGPACELPELIDTQVFMLGLKCCVLLWLPRHRELTLCQFRLYLLIITTIKYVFSGDQRTQYQRQRYCPNAPGWVP